MDAAELYGIFPEEVTEEQIEALRNQYQQDWTEWPTEFGAPYYDRNGNGVYDPGLDEPGLANADQVIWFVCNDLDSARAWDAFHSYPLGLELQVTMWGYDDPTGPLAQTSFRCYRLINKSGARIDSMYLSQWSDPDVGNVYDDAVGCDSLLDLAFAYNFEENDEEYQRFGLPPAAVGYLLLQGPRIPSEGDSAYFAFHWWTGFKNLNMTSYVFLDPSCIYSVEWYPNDVYNFIRGYVPSGDVNNPEPYRHGIDPHGTPTF